MTRVNQTRCAACAVTLCIVLCTATAAQTQVEIPRDLEWWIWVAPEDIPPEIRDLTPEEHEQFREKTAEIDRTIEEARLIEACLPPNTPERGKSRRLRLLLEEQPLKKHYEGYEREYNNALAGALGTLVTNGREGAFLLIPQRKSEEHREAVAAQTTELVKQVEDAFYRRKAHARGLRTEANIRGVVQGMPMDIASAAVTAGQRVIEGELLPRAMEQPGFEEKWKRLQELRKMQDEVLPALRDAAVQGDTAAIGRALLALLSTIRAEDPSSDELRQPIIDAYGASKKLKTREAREKVWDAYWQVKRLLDEKIAELLD
jgi:hypothetical protein